MFKSVKLELMAYVGFLNVTVWVNDNKLHYSKDGMRLDDNTDDTISTMSAEEFSKRIAGLRIEAWKEEYMPEDVMVLDGESWMVEYKDSEHGSVSRTGENAYPANWKSFLKLLSDVAGNIGYF